jgi:hypothetical protein
MKPVDVVGVRDEGHASRDRGSPEGAAKVLDVSWGSVADTLISAGELPPIVGGRSL